MKKFIFRCLLFVLPVILMAWFADVFISKNLKKINQYKEGEFTVWNDLYYKNIHADIVIYGASRAWLQVDPSMIEDSLHVTAYNLGINSHNFWLESFRHRLLLNYTKPKLIIHSLGMATVEKRADLFNADQFLPYMLFNKEMEDVIISYKGYKDVDFKIPLVRYFGKKDALISTMKYVMNPGNNPAKRIKGYEGINDTTWHNDIALVKKHMKYYEVKIDTATVTLFENYLRDCQKQGIIVLLLYSPELIDGQLFTHNRNDVIQIFKNLSAKYNMPFWDYSNDSICFDKKYFFNAEHLNKMGAELFTKQLIDSIKRSPLLNEISKKK